MDNLARPISILLRKIGLNVRRALYELHLIEKAHDPGYEEYSPDLDSKKPETNGEVLAAIKALQAAQDSAEAKKYALDHRRYRLEWKGYRVARWGFIALFVYTFLTLVIVIYTGRSADAAKQAAEAAIFAQRPWLKFTLELNLPLGPIPTGYSFAVSPHVQNVGKSVATDVSMRVEERTIAFSNTFPVAEGYREWCENTKPNIRGLETYFPDEGKDSAPWTLNIPETEIEKGEIISGERRFVTLVYGCLIYGYEGSTKLHHTGVVYELQELKGGIPVLLRSKNIYTAKNLMFDHFPFAWEYAN